MNNLLEIISAINIYCFFEYFWVGINNRQPFIYIFYKQCLYNTLLWNHLIFSNSLSQRGITPFWKSKRGGVLTISLPYFRSCVLETSHLKVWGQEGEMAFVFPSHCQTCDRALLSWKWLNTCQWQAVNEFPFCLVSLYV